jgi:hypothetical protein
VKYYITNELGHLDDALEAANKAVALFDKFSRRTHKAAAAHLMIIIYTIKVSAVERPRRCPQGPRIWEEES